MKVIPNEMKAVDDLIKALVLRGTIPKDKAAKTLIRDLLLLPSIRAIGAEDLLSVLGSCRIQVVIYSSNIPFDTKGLEEKIKDSTSILYGIYGNNQSLDMHTVEKIDSIINHNSGDCLGTSLYLPSLKPELITVSMLICKPQPANTSENLKLQ